METLRDIVGQATAIEEIILDGNGDLAPDALAIIEDTLRKLVQKTDACVCVLERLELTEEYWRGKAQQATKIARSLANAHAGLKQYVKDTMMLNGHDTLIGDDWKFKISVKENAKLELNDQLGQEWKIVETTMVPDKERIQAALQTGELIDGARLVDVVTLRTSANKKR